MELMRVHDHLDTHHSWPQRMGTCMVGLEHMAFLAPFQLVFAQHFNSTISCCMCRPWWNRVKRYWWRWWCCNSSPPLLLLPPLSCVWANKAQHTMKGWVASSILLPHSKPSVVLEPQFCNPNQVWFRFYKISDRNLLFYFLFTFNLIFLFSKSNQNRQLRFRLQVLEPLEVWF